MYNIVRQNGQDVHIVIKPDKDCVVNSGLGSVRGARMAEMSYSQQRNGCLFRLELSHLTVNRRSNLTPHRRPILTPSRGEVWW
jgi:hypothetical protein